MFSVEGTDRVPGYVKVGASVGVLDTAFVYPVAVLAVRRECGTSLRAALKQGNYWAGASTALALLVPYSIAIEAVTRGFGEPSLPMATLGTSLIVALGLQPIEKKLTTDQLLQKPNYRRSSAGFFALWGRETVYVTSINVLSPLVAQVSSFGPFAVGFAAGVVSAPFQTVSAILKDERTRPGSTNRDVLVSVFKRSDILGVACFTEPESGRCAPARPPCCGRTCAATTMTTPERAVDGATGFANRSFYSLSSTSSASSTQRNVSARAETCLSHHTPLILAVIVGDSAAHACLGRG